MISLQSHISSAFDAAKRGTDTHKITAALPHIFRHAPDAAYTLLTRFPVHATWQAESFALMGTQGLTPTQRQSMTTAINPTWKGLNIAPALSQIGQISFSFPLWRFTSMNINGQPSLIERYGHTRLTRNTDIRDETLPKSNPNRDQFGTGFTHHNDDWSVEYRRAYILCANHTPENRIILVIRNSSYFFGRNRLPYTAYISFTPFTHERLDNLTPNDFAHPNIFSPLQRAFNKQRSIPTAEKIRRLNGAIKHFQTHDQHFSQWLHTTGYDATRSLIDHLSQSKTPPFYLGLIPRASAPWHPETVMPATPTHLEIASRLTSKKNKLALLSGQHGDHPALPKI